MKTSALSFLVLTFALPGWTQSTVYNVSPSRAFGQAKLAVVSGAPNLVEGRELFGPQSLAIDTSVTPPILYVADSANNRVLAWKSATAFTKGDFADLAIGQPDLVTTVQGGPGTNQSTGLATPTSVAVDKNGNLFVADTGNNRILRYPQPFSQTGDFPTPDFVIGQKSIGSGNQPNQGSTVPSANTIALSRYGAVFTTAMTFDKQGNLWLTDSGNNRVVRYPAAALTPGNNQPPADLVVGQTGFEVSATPNPQLRSNKNGLFQPSGLAINDAGDLYVSDDYARVLYFKAPVSGFSQPATRILGVVLATATDQNPRTLAGCPATPPQPCEGTLGAVLANGGTVPPQGLAMLGNNLLVADTGNNRIVKFDTPDKWPGECIPTQANQFTCAQGTIFSPVAIQFIGQRDGQSVKANQGSRDGSASSINQPAALAVLGTDIYVADAGNNRVIVFPQTGGTYSAATRLLGQIDWPYIAPNLVEGRELFIYAGSDALGAANGGVGIAVDYNSNPPHLYIADRFNHRVLGFNDVRNFKSGGRADIVIGQPDFFHANPNYATNDAGSPTDSTLSNPIGLVVDANGNLFVADAGNGRVLRFPRPFDQTGIYRANLVLGQSNYFSVIQDASSRTMRAPYGLALTQAGHLLVSDVAHNRVLLFRKGTSGDFTSGQAAAAVFGQPDFTTTTFGSDPSKMYAPRGIATDSSDRLYVCDTINQRVSVFTGVLNGEVNPPARFSASVNYPHGIAVNSFGETWVASPGLNLVLKFPVYEAWLLNPQDIARVSASAPIGVALDAHDNLLTGEGINRVSIYYPQAVFSNAASYSSRGMSPGGLYYLARRAVAFSPDGTNAVASGAPWPVALGDISVTFDGNPVPVYNVLADRVTFQVPSSAPVGQFSDVQLIRASSGEILASGAFKINSADPAFFTQNAQGFGQLAALNQDGTVNGPSNEAVRGSVITFFGTGIGLLPNMPPDGQGAPGALPATDIPHVAFVNPGPGFIPDANVLYFGAAPGFPGLFQLNVKIPDTVPPSKTGSFAMTFKDFPSNDGPTSKVVTTVGIK